MKSKIFLSGQSGFKNFKNHIGLKFLNIDEDLKWFKIINNDIIFFIMKINKKYYIKSESNAINNYLTNNYYNAIDINKLNLLIGKHNKKRTIKKSNMSLSVKDLKVKLLFNLLDNTLNDFKLKYNKENKTIIKNNSFKSKEELKELNIFNNETISSFSTTFLNYLVKICINSFYFRKYKLNQYYFVKINIIDIDKINTNFKNKEDFIFENTKKDYSIFKIKGFDETYIFNIRLYDKNFYLIVSSNKETINNLLNKPINNIGLFNNEKEQLKEVRSIFNGSFDYIDEKIKNKSFKLTFNDLKNKKVSLKDFKLIYNDKFHYNYNKLLDETNNKNNYNQIDFNYYDLKTVVFEKDNGISLKERDNFDYFEKIKFNKYLNSNKDINKFNVSFVDNSTLKINNKTLTFKGNKGLLITKKETKGFSGSRNINNVNKTLVSKIVDEMDINKDILCCGGAKGLDSYSLFLFLKKGGSAVVFLPFKPKNSYFNNYFIKKGLMNNKILLVYPNRKYKNKSDYYKRNELIALYSKSIYLFEGGKGTNLTKNIIKSLNKDFKEIY